MKRQTMFFGILVSFALFVWVLPQASAQNYGQIRALKRRADTVTHQKNSFVARVLSSYKIPYQITEQGIVARLHIENRWYDVNQIEIVPVTRGRWRVPGHSSRNILLHRRRNPTPGFSN